MLFGDDNTCQDCLNPGSGDCAECNGTGCEQDLFEAFAEAIADISQNCKVCHGTGKCVRCDGKGYV